MTLLLDRGLLFVLVIPAIVFHEVAHGRAAWWLGDPTAKTSGRLSLNPLRHIDPFGTVMLPLLLAFMGLPVIGYAKPVPIDPRYFRDYRKGMLITGLAGPVTNLALATVAGVVVRATFWMPGAAAIVPLLFYRFAMVNLVLMSFNLIPIPPLDGSRVLPVFLSDRAMASYHQWERYGIWIVLAFVWFAPRLLGFSPIESYLSVTVDPLLRLLSGV